MSTLTHILDLARNANADRLAPLKVDYDRMVVACVEDLSEGCDLTAMAHFLGKHGFDISTFERDVRAEHRRRAQVALAKV